jgi:hypothetical protein
MKKTLIAGAGTGIMAGILLMNAGTAMADTTNYGASPYAQSSKNLGMHMMRRWNGTSKINALANNLGLDQNAINAELKAGKNLKQILQENGIVPGQLNQAFKNKKVKK